MEIDNWKDNFGELNLHGKVVGDSSIDWSCDHQIAVGTNKKVVACDMSMLIAGSKIDEVGFMIENVPVIIEKNYYLNETPKFLSQFEQACAQTSNTKATPDYEVYKFFLDPALYNEKFKELKGYKSIKFSHPACLSATGTELLAVLSVDYSLGVYQKVSAGLHAKWTLLCDLSAMLIDYLQANNSYFPNHNIDSSSEFEDLREKKYCSCLSCMSWSDVYSIEEERYCFLAVSTLNGFVVIWKFNLNDKANFIPVINYIFFTYWKKVLSITWLRNFPTNSSQQTKTTASIAIANSEGQICCQTLSISNNGINVSSWDSCTKKYIWEEEDRLAARNLDWIECEDASLFVASKGHVLALWLLNSNLEIIYESFLQNIHCMPIVCVNLFETNEKLHCYTSSSDGVIALIDISVKPTLDVKLNKIVGTASDIGSFKVVSPAVLHGTSLSPNKAFLVMLTSRPHVRLSVQVDNEASIFMKRIMTPEEAAEILLKAVSCETTRTLYKFLDLIELTREYYAMKQKFVPSLEAFLASSDIKLEYEVKKLQLRWYLLKLKKKVRKCHRKTALVDELIPSYHEDAGCKLVEEILTIRQMTRVLKTWYCHADHSDSSVPVVPLLKLLASKEEFLSVADTTLLRSLRSLPALDVLPMQQTCSFTSLPAEISADCKTASSLDGSSWPLCCLSFNLLQGFEKRKCELSGLYSAFPDPQNSDWMNEILENPCVFSGAPLRRYIN